jgi:hypothetical protein
LCILAGKAEYRLVTLIELRLEHTKDMHVLAHAIMDLMLAKNAFLFVIILSSNLNALQRMSVHEDPLYTML